MKSTTAVQNPGDPIVLPRHLRSDEVDYECELAVVIGKRCKNVSRERALEYVLGYTCANDVSARDWQGKWGGSQWCRGKTFDTFAPLGPCLVTTDEIPNPNALAIKFDINGEVLQDWNTERHDLRRAAADRVPQRQHDAAAGHGHPDRHAARRGLRPQAAALAQGRRRRAR